MNTATKAERDQASDMRLLYLGRAKAEGVYAWPRVTQFLIRMSVAAAYAQSGPFEDHDHDTPETQAK